MLTQARVDELLLQWEEHRDQGRDISPEELCRDCQEYLDEVRAQIARLQSMDARLNVTTDGADERSLQSTVLPDSSGTGADGQADGSLDSPSQSTGRYAFVKPHAKGGLGEVCIAQDTELNRRIALKRIQTRHAGDPNSRRRFLVEAEVTARLEHPGIVPVYGLVTDANGQPSYAMRFIEGESLADAIKQLHRASGGRQPPVDSTATEGTKQQEADASRSPALDSLAFRQLLQRFIAVCNTIAFAHNRGIIHRDIKPANVMLGKFGETLVVDWGLAKPVDRRPEDREVNGESTIAPTALADTDQDTPQTQIGQAIGTPAYMSPEQAAGRWEIVGPVSDIYSLGATLYVLLTGKAPFTDSNIAQLLTKVQQGDFTAPRSIQRTVPAALEAICLKAMAKQPEARYLSALDLAGDLERWLADEAVAVHREPWTVRAGRWGRKHRVLVTSAAVLLCAVTLGLTLGLLAVNSERAETARERDEKGRALEAETLARKQTMAALRKLTDDFVVNHISRGAQMTEMDKQFLRNIIKYYEGVAAMTNEIGESRRIRAEGYGRIALLRDLLKEHQEAEVAFADALALYEQLVVDFPANREFQEELARCYNNLGILLKDMGRLKEAEAACVKAKAQYERLRASFPSELEFASMLAACHNNLGVVYNNANRLEEAEAAFTEALAQCELIVADYATGREFRRELAIYQLNLGNILRDRGRPVEAETRYAEALTTRKKLAADFNTRPELQMDLAGSHNDLGRHYLERGRLEEAEKAYKEALAIQKQLVANYPARPEFRRELALFHNNLGNLLRKSGRLEGAETSFTDALALYKQLAADFPARAEFCHDIATSQNNLGLLLMGTGRPNDAEVALINALAFYKQLPADYANRATVRNQIAGSLVNLALLNMKRGEFMMAKTFLGEALPHHNAALKANPRHPDFRSFYRQNLYISVLVHASLQDQPAAIRAAVLIHDLGWEPPTDAFSAASLLSRCIARVQDDNKESTGERKRAAILYGDEAMKMLRDALTKGFKGIEHMKYDYDLTPLRNRPDFQKLLADLEKANPADPKK